MICYNLYVINIIRLIGWVCTFHEFLEPLANQPELQKDWKVSINNAHYQQHFYCEVEISLGPVGSEKSDDRD